jgi:hypothetical protein
MYANLAESAYNKRPLNFPQYQKNSIWKKIDYSQDTLYKTNSGEASFTKGGTNLPNDGIVYLQPDLVDKTMSIQVPKRTVAMKLKRIQLVERTRYADRYQGRF